MSERNGCNVFSAKIVSYGKILTHKHSWLFPSSSSMPLPLILKRIYLAYSALKESEELQKLSKSTKYEAGAGRLRRKNLKTGGWKGGLFGVSICVQGEGSLIRGFRRRGGREGKGFLRNVAGGV